MDARKESKREKGRSDDQDPATHNERARRERARRGWRTPYPISTCVNGDPIFPLELEFVTCTPYL